MPSSESAHDLKLITFLNGYVLCFLEKIRIWARNDYHLNLQNISTKTEYVLKVLENYFNMTYPLPKLDLVALPKFRNSKQADNWGIILFR